MMKTKQIKRRELTAFFSLTVAFCGLIFGFSATAQDTRRERVIARPTPTATATPSVSPTLAPTATPTPAKLQTLPDLQSKIRSILLRPQLQRGQVGIKIVSLDTNKIVFEENAEKYFMPASNMKNFTISTALEKLTPD